MLAREKMKHVTERLADLLQMSMKMYPNTEPSVIHGKMDIALPAYKGVELEMVVKVEASTCMPEFASVLVAVHGDLWAWACSFYSGAAYFAILDGKALELVRGDCARRFTGKDHNKLTGLLGRGVKALYKYSKSKQRWSLVDDVGGMDTGSNGQLEESPGAGPPVPQGSAQV